MALNLFLGMKYHALLFWHPIVPCPTGWAQLMLYETRIRALFTAESVFATRGDSSKLGKQGFRGGEGATATATCGLVGGGLCSVVSCRCAANAASLAVYSVGRRAADTQWAWNMSS